MELIRGYGKLLLAALLIAGVAGLLYLAEKNTRFGKWKPWLRQSVTGVLFGALAVLATEYGIPAGGATLNVRDAAPLCAGLIFGAPAGIIAGVIGGVERFFAVYWGVGEYTRIACSVSTVIAGLLAAVLRKYLFDNRKPGIFYGLCTGLVMEVLHMLMIFITNMDDVRGAFVFVRRCAAPMILFNGLAVMLAVLLVTRIGKEPIAQRKDRKKIAQTFQRWLLLCVSAAFLVTCAFTVLLQTQLTNRDAERLLALNIDDVRADIVDASDANLLRINRAIAAQIDAAGTDADPDALIAQLADAYAVAEIDIIGTDGVISASTNADFIGFDMASGGQSAAFLVLLSDKTELVQSYQPIAYDQAVSRKYAGVALRDGGFVQVGYDAENFHRDIAEAVTGATRNRHVGEGGWLIICDEQWTIVSDRNGYEGETLVKAGIRIDRASMPEGERFSAEVYGQPCICMYTVTEGYAIVAALPRTEALFPRDVSVYVMAFMEIILFAVLFAVIYFLIKKLVVNNIWQINRSLAQITGGNLDITVNVRSNEEFASLSDDINATIVTLKRYIAEAAARIDRELEFARTIQQAALPSVFPPYPGRREFDLFASMDAAKEVGGDFFDFFFVDEEHLAFMIADVSGKGIPAAMFMMTAKTLIKSLCESGKPVDEALTVANDGLCRGNDAGMFVTVFLGVLDVRTGAVSYANAGHNPPLVRHGGEAFAFLPSRPGLVLAGMEGVRYRRHELTLAPGDTLFLYTDGVTEATDTRDALYGEDRLRQLLDENCGAAVEDIPPLVRADIDRFVGDAPQFDDITMLALRFWGDGAVREMRFLANAAQTPAAAAFTERALLAADCPRDAVMKLNVVFDELFSNIVRYSGATEVCVACGVQDGCAVLRLTDDGAPYDPTAAPTPDTSLPAEERATGGLGIHMARKMTDRLDYAHADGKNVLTAYQRL